MPTTRSVRRSAAAALGLAALIAGPSVAATTGGAATSDVLPVDAARAYLVEEAPALGLTRADVTDLRVTDAYASAHNGISHVYLQQVVDGLPVAGSAATVNVAADGHVVHAGSRLLARVAERSSGRAVLSAADAVAAAARGLGLAAPRDLQVLGSSGGVERATLLSDGGISAKPIPAALSYQALADGTARLAWSLEIELPSEDHWYLVAVDAENGRLLVSDDIVESHSVEEAAGAVRTSVSPVVRRTATGASFAEVAQADGASYRVYAQPLESPNDGARSLVKNPADALGSPFGWHDLDGKPGADTTTTRGNNTNTYADTIAGIAKNSPDPLSQPDGGSALVFESSVDHSQPAVAHRDAAVVNLFYWNNIMHDFLARYGFDEASGNFQVTNYTGEGRGGDAVQAEAQDGGGTNNANFATPADGSQPRMQMYLWQPPAGRVDVRDGDFDSGVVAHEYGHGVSNRLTGGPSNVGCLSTSQVQEQMGEGWSDFMSYVTTMRPGDDGATPRGIGTYVLYQADRKAKGIRITPYSTNKAVNPSSYDTVKTAAAPHGVGYVWATMLWEVYWNLVEKHGFNPDLDAAWTAGGNNLAVQLVMDGMKFQPCRPGFVDGRDAILAADRALTGGANQCEIWRGFAKRGLGVNAKQGSSASKTDGSNGFALPEGC